MNILVLNAGSSSLKFQIIATDLERIRQDKDVRLLRGEVERIGAEAVVTVQKGDGPKQKLTASLKDISGALDFIIRWAASPDSGVSEIQSMADIHAVGHRVVHGGELFTDSVLIDDEVMKGIENCIDLAPLHNPTNLRGIRAMRDLLGPQIPQVAVFDTAFHHSLAERAYLYAIPYHLYLRYRIRRYGFHGISHRYMAYRYRTIRNLPREQTNIVSLHLGNGCSAAAIRAGRLSGHVHGHDAARRIGDGNAIRRCRSRHSRFYRRKGRPLPSRSGDPAQQAVGPARNFRSHARHACPARRSRRSTTTAAPNWPSICSATGRESTSALFSRPWAERTPSCSREASARIRSMVRASICEGLEWAGLSLDAEKNQKTIGVEGMISREDSRLAAYVIPTDEELLIARDTARCILGEPNPQ